MGNKTDFVAMPNPEGRTRLWPPDRVSRQLCRGLYLLLMTMLLACSLHPLLQREEAAARRAAWAAIRQEAAYALLDEAERQQVEAALEARFTLERASLDAEWKVIHNGTKVVYRSTRDTFTRAEFAALYEEHLTVEGRKYLMSVQPESNSIGQELGQEQEQEQSPELPPGVELDPEGRPIDSDRDGVPDYRDQQPHRPLRPGEQVDKMGVVVVMADSDGDGVPDPLDLCPELPGKAADDGCPVNQNANTNDGQTIRSPNRVYELTYNSAPELYGAIRTYAARQEDAEAQAFAERLSQVYLEQFPEGEARTEVSRLRQSLRAARTQSIVGEPTRRPASYPAIEMLDTLRLECMQDKYDQGLLAFDTIPNIMLIDEPYTVIIRIDHSQNRQRFVQDIQERTQVPVNIDTIDFSRQTIIGSVQLEPIEVGRFMLAEIKVADDPDAFDILDRYDVGFQEIDCFKPAVWEYTLVPRKEGRHQLNFNIYISNDGIEKRPYDRAGLTKIIDVQVVRSFWRDNLAWLSGIGFAVLALLAFFLLRRRSQAVQQQYAAFSEEDFRQYENSLQNSEIEKVLTAILAKLPDGNPLRKDAQLCLSNYKQVRKDYSLNIISYDDYSQKSATASLAVINIVNELKAKHQEEKSSTASA